MRQSINMCLLNQILELLLNLANRVQVNTWHNHVVIPQDCQLLLRQFLSN